MAKKKTITEATAFSEIDAPPDNAQVVHVLGMEVIGRALTGPEILKIKAHGMGLLPCYKSFALIGWDFKYFEYFKVQFESSGSEIGYYYNLGQFELEENQIIALANNIGDTGDPVSAKELAKIREKNANIQ